MLNHLCKSIVVVGQTNAAAASRIDKMVNNTAVGDMLRRSLKQTCWFVLGDSGNLVRLGVK